MPYLVMNEVPKIGFLGNPNQFLPKVYQGFEDLIHHKASYLLMKSEGLSLSVNDSHDAAADGQFLEGNYMSTSRWTQSASMIKRPVVTLICKE